VRAPAELYPALICYGAIRKVDRRSQRFIVTVNPPSTIYHRVRFSIYVIYIYDIVHMSVGCQGFLLFSF